MIGYSLIEDIKGERYRAFISYCLANSDFFSLTCCKMKKSIEYKFTKEIQSYFFKAIQTNIWYYNRVYEEKLNIRLYHSDLSLVDFFVEQFGSVFSYQYDGVEDICFFCDDRVMFASVTHEKFAEIFPSDKIKLIDFQEFSKWKKRDLTLKDYEYLPRFKDFL